MNPEDPTQSDPDPAAAAGVGGSASLPDCPPQPRSPAWDMVNDLFAPKSQQPLTDAILRDRGRYELDPPELAGYLVSAVRAMLAFIDVMTDHGYAGFANVLHHEDVPLPREVMAQVRLAAQRWQEDSLVLVARLVSEGVQLLGHPRIRFDGPPHRRRARLWNGPDVWEVISEALGVASVEELDLDQHREQVSALVAPRCDLDPLDVTAAIAFWREHPSDVDSAIADNDRWSRAATLAAQRAGGAEVTPGAVRLAYADLVSEEAGQVARPLPRSKSTPARPAGRDPGRVDPVLAALRSAWETLPDLRLGQLVAAAAGTRDPFVLEEDAWLEAFHRMAGEPADGTGFEP